MVSLYIDNCRTCILKAQKRKPKAPLTPFYGSHPNDIIQVDLLGSLPDNKYKYTMILVFIDKFTGWAEAVPLKQTTSEIIARSLLDVWISRNGLFKHVHSDRGPQFTGEILKIVFKLLGMIYQSHTCSYTPKSNGGSEALVKIVKNLLKSFCSDKPETWPEMLQQVMFAYRTSVSRITKYSPHFLHTGASARLPIDLIFGTFPQNKFESQGEYAYNLFKKLHKTYRYVDNHLKANREYVKQQYDNRCNIKPFKIGDWVYLWKPRKKGQHTFQSNFYGPYEIIAKVTDYTYRIDVGQSKIHNIVPHDLLRLEPNGPEVDRRDFDPIDELEWDYDYEFPQPYVTLNDDPSLETLTDNNNPENEKLDTRPIVITDVRDNTQQDREQIQRRTGRERRPPDRYQGYILD